MGDEALSCMIPVLSPWKIGPIAHAFHIYFYGVLRKENKNLKIKLKKKSS